MLFSKLRKSKNILDKGVNPVVGLGRNKSKREIINDIVLVHETKNFRCILLI